MVYHAGVSWAGGGQLGVDVFFVLSGFLVTSLLLSENARTGAISLGRFWANRARRLLPALMITFVGICAYTEWVSSGIAPSQMRGNALATLLYVANWHYVLTGQGYFARSSGTSPLLHTWSLAVEEQFYLVWPVAVALVLRRRTRRALAWLAGALAAASAALCAVLSLTGGVGLDRLYYGTDTRVQTIMVGALLAILISPAAGKELSGQRTPRADRILGPVALGAAAGLVWFLHAVPGTDLLLYRGGFLLVASATAAVVLLVVRRPDHPLSRALSWRPLRYVGRISYGLYLYHWPLFLVLTQTRVGLSGPALVAVRFAATFVMADLSFRLVERPIRSRRDRPVLDSRRPKMVRARRLAVPAGAIAAVVALLVVVTATPATPAMALASSAAAPGPGYVAPGGATAARPATVMLIGDSLALTLGAGLDQGSTRWGVTVANDGAIGCDLDPTTTVNVEGSITRTAQGCPHWRTHWAQQVARTNPDVVLVLLGRWESLNRLMQGRWTHPGEPSFDAHLRSELTQVIDITSAHGARVVFLTLPYIAETTVQPDGRPWDVNLPSRTDAYNADVRAAVARRPKVASILDLNRILDPQGRYTSYIDGVRVRSYDDEHISTAGGLWLRPRLLPAIARLGSGHYDQRIRSARAVST